MKILYIIHDNRKGGAAVSFLATIKGVSKEHEVFVLMPHKKGYIPNELDRLGIWHKNAHYFWWEIAKVGNPCLDAVRFFLYKMLNVYNHIEARRLAKLIRKLGIDIIHSNSSTINIGNLISEITGVPHVWHLRELGEQDFRLSPVMRGDSIKSVLSHGRSDYIAISKYVTDYYSSIIENAKIVVFGESTSMYGISEGLVSNIDETFKNIYQIYNGIDPSYNYRKKESDYNLDSLIFLISGNYCEEKGQIDVAHAAGLLIKKGVTNFKVYMAGRGDFAEVKRYIAKFDATGADAESADDAIPGRTIASADDVAPGSRSDVKPFLSDHIVFCGLVDDMLSLRRKCDVEIVASRTEAFGRVTVEAMRASNPVIGSAAGGTTELIEDGVTGFLYEYKDNEALAERRERFIDDPALARVMGQKAYEWAADRFTGEENVAGILAVYEEIAQSHRA